MDTWWRDSIETPLDEEQSLTLWRFHKEDDFYQVTISRCLLVLSRMSAFLSLPPILCPILSQIPNRWMHVVYNKRESFHVPCVGVSRHTGIYWLDTNDVCFSLLPSRHELFVLRCCRFTFYLNVLILFSHKLDTISLLFSWSIRKVKVLKREEREGERKEEFSRMRE